METVGRIGLLSSDEVRECLNDIDTFLIHLEDNAMGAPRWEDSVYVMATGSNGIINNSTVVSIPREYGIFKGRMDVPLRSMFSSYPPYKNTLDAFFNMAPKWFVDKYQQKNRAWEKIHKTDLHISDCNIIR